MRASVLVLFGSCLLASSAIPLSAAMAQSAGDNGRYAMTPTEGGFLRLDTRTGEVALCRPKADTVECRASPLETSPLASEVERLAKENADLKARLAGQPPTPPAAAAPPSRAREEMDRALDYAERFMRRMMRILREEAPPDRI